MNNQDKKKLKRIIDEAECIIVASDNAGGFIGSKEELLTLFTVIAEKLYYELEATEEELERCLNFSRMSNDELQKEVLNKLEALLEVLKNK